MLNYNWFNKPSQYWIKQDINKVKTIHEHLGKSNFKLRKPMLTNGKYNIFVDTETTGLNIIQDKPFLLIFGYLIDRYTLVVYTIDINENTISKIKKVMEKLFYPADEVFFMNTKYDIHMLENVGLIYEAKNLSDLSILVRLLTPIETLQIGLKHTAKTHLGEESIVSAKELDLVWKRVTQKGKNELNELLKLENNPLFDSYVKIFNFIHIATFGYDELPQNIKKIYLDWMKRHYKTNFYEKYQATYYEVYLNEPEIMLRYAADDVVLTAKLVFFFGIFFTEVNKFNSLYEQEKKMIYILYKQEKEGLYINLDYLKNSIKKIKVVLDLRKKQLSKLCGSETTAGQHKKILEIFKEKYKVTPLKNLPKGIIKESVDDGTLKKLLVEERRKVNPNKNLIHFISTLTELRTLEKWYQTYAKKLYFRALSFGDHKLHTSFNQSGARTGRLSSDFQQFPKEALTTTINDRKYELYDPRKIVILDPKLKNEYVYAYLDFSNVELRVQADYIQRWFPGEEINLIKAFLPLFCENIQTNEIFNINNLDDLKKWDEKELWLDLETKEFWTPTDLHGLNAVNAFGKRLLLPENEKEYKHLRSAGKTINFACNYGAGLNTLLNNSSLMEFTKDQIRSLFESYKKNYPGLKQYSKRVEEVLDKDHQIFNYYNRRYFRKNTQTPSYYVNNYLVQGTAADYLKEKMIDVSNFIKDKKLKIRLLANIHDEIQFIVPVDEINYLKNIKEIMEKTDKFIIPIVADLELSKTSWKDKFSFEF